MYFSRGKNKIQNSYTLKHIYSQYIKDTEVNSPYYVDYKTFIKLNKLYLESVINYLLDTSLEFMLPYKLGSFQIIKKKITFKYQHNNFVGSIDWPASVKVGKQVFYTNDHTGGYKYLFMWNKGKTAHVTNINQYKFVPCRAVKRRLAYYIKNKIRDYFER